MGIHWGTIILLFKPISRRKLVCTTCFCHELCMSLTLSAPTVPLLYADEELTGVLFETSKTSQKSEEAVKKAITQPAQIAFSLLIVRKCMLLTCYITCQITCYICL